MGYLVELMHLRWRLANAEREDRGASLVEYALLIGLIAVVCVVAVQVLGGETSEGFSEYGTSLATAQN